MISKKDAAEIAGELAVQYEFHRRRADERIDRDGEDHPEAMTRARVAGAVWDAAVAVSLAVEDLTDHRVTSGRFLQWVQTGPAKIADVERQLGGAA